jgi:hypothetical protein
MASMAKVDHTAGVTQAYAQFDRALKADGLDPGKELDKIAEARRRIDAEAAIYAAALELREKLGATAFTAPFADAFLDGIRRSIAAAPPTLSDPRAAAREALEKHEAETPVLEALQGLGQKVEQLEKASRYERLFPAIAVLEWATRVLEIAKRASDPTLKARLEARRQQLDEIVSASKSVITDIDAETLRAKWYREDPSQNEKHSALGRTLKFAVELPPGESRESMLTLIRELVALSGEQAIARDETLGGRMLPASAAPGLVALAGDPAIAEGERRMAAQLAVRTTPFGQELPQRGNAEAERLIAEEQGYRRFLDRDRELTGIEDALKAIDARGHLEQVRAAIDQIYSSIMLYNVVLPPERQAPVRAWLSDLAKGPFANDLGRSSLDNRTKLIAGLLEKLEG